MTSAPSFFLLEPPSTWMDPRYVKGIGFRVALSVLSMLSHRSSHAFALLLLFQFQIYFPCACIWLAILNGITPNAGSYILLIILSTIGSAGAAPVPASGLVLVITAYNTVFGGTGIPDGFEFVVAIDWFLDRCITALNVTGDTVVAHIVACRTPISDEDPTNVTKKSETMDVTGGLDGSAANSSSDEDMN